jgi:hypothetical protein
MNGESIKYQKCDSVSIGLGKLTILQASVGVWDVMSLLPDDFPRIDGVISLETFSNQLITLDLLNNSLIVETPTSFRKKTRKATLIRSRFANGLSGQELTLFLGCIKNGITYWFLFDSANLDNVLFSHQTAYEWGLEPLEQASRKEYFNQPIVLNNSTIMSTISSTVIIHDGALNFEVLSQFQFHLDLKKNRVWIH